MMFHLLENALAAKNVFARCYRGPLDFFEAYLTVGVVQVEKRFDYFVVILCPPRYGIYVFVDRQRTVFSCCQPCCHLISCQMSNASRLPVCCRCVNMVYGINPVRVGSFFLAFLVRFRLGLLNYRLLLCYKKSD